MEGMMFYSQHGEDKWLVENVELPDKGIFVEVGAYDGIEASNTYHFEKHCGWSGLCIEGNPNCWKALLTNRQCEKFFGAVGTDKDATFNLSDIPTHSGFGRQGYGLKVPTLSLGTLLDAYGCEEVDLLSLDTEGAELSVWESGYFSGMYRYPRIVIIEHDTAGLMSARKAILDYFLKLPYLPIHETAGNLIFECTEKA
jgi:FkbM family methyltransferase